MDSISFETTLESHSEAVVFANKTLETRLTSLTTKGKGSWSTASAQGDLEGPPMTILLAVKAGEEIKFESAGTDLSVSGAVYVK